METYRHSASGVLRRRMFQLPNKFWIRFNQKLKCSWEDEAKHIRRIYEPYQEFGTVRAAKVEAERHGIFSRATSRCPGLLLGRGNIYRILTNPIYMGKISHKGQLGDGQHEAIISPKVWHAVQGKLMANIAREREQPNAAISSPLGGIIFDRKGERLTPSHAVKGGRRYRYYISNILVREPSNTGGLRLSALEIEGAVCKITHDLLTDPQQVSMLNSSEFDSPSSVNQFIASAKALVEGIRTQTPYAQLLHLRQVVTKVVIGIDEVVVSVDCRKLSNLVRGIQDNNKPSEESDTAQPIHTIAVPMRIGRRGRETRLILHNAATQSRPVDRSLTTMVARGYTWRHQIIASEAASVTEIANRENITDGYVSRIIDLGFLAPDIIAVILGGTAPVDLTANRLQAIRRLPLDWPSQCQVLGVASKS